MHFTESPPVLKKRSMQILVSMVCQSVLRVLSLLPFQLFVQNFTLLVDCFLGSYQLYCITVEDAFLNVRYYQSTAHLEELRLYNLKVIGI